MTDCEELIEEVEILRAENLKALRKLQIIQDASCELIELLREKWAPVPADALTLYMASFVGGLSQEYLKALPENGVTWSGIFPDIGNVNISVWKGDNVTKIITQLVAERSKMIEKIHQLNKRLAELEGNPVGT